MMTLFPAVLMFLLLLSAADPGGPAWPAVRGLALLATIVWARKQPPYLLHGLAFGFAMVAVAGLPGLDWALYALLFVLRPFSLPSLAFAGLAIGLVEAASLLYPGPTLFPFANRNHFAVLVEITLPLLVYCAERHRHPGWLAGSGVLLVAALAGGSRTGTLLLLILAAALLRRWQGGRQAWLAVPIAALGLGILLLSSPQDRIFDPLRGDRRAEIWQSALAMISARPLSGWGPGGFPSSYPAFALFDSGQFINAAHSDWLEWAVEFGLPAALAGIAALLFWLRKNIHFHPSWGILVGALHASVDFPFHVPGLLAFAVAVAGSISAHGAHIQTQPPDR